jgi:hypothetical protein
MRTAWCRHCAGEITSRLGARLGFDENDGGWAQIAAVNKEMLLTVGVEQRDYAASASQL